ncbi:hypothetical protein ACXWRS_12575, partial [Streptococcus pyogenes]
GLLVRPIAPLLSFSSPLFSSLSSLLLFFLPLPFFSFSFLPSFLLLFSSFFPLFSPSSFFLLPLFFLSSPSFFSFS